MEYFKGYTLKKYNKNEEIIKIYIKVLETIRYILKISI